MTGEETKRLKEKFEQRSGRNLYVMPQTLNKPEEWHKYIDSMWQFIQSEIITPYEKQLAEVEKGIEYVLDEGHQGCANWNLLNELLVELKSQNTQTK